MLYKSATPRATKSQAGRSITTGRQETLQSNICSSEAPSWQTKAAEKKEIRFKNPSRSESQQILPLIQQLSVPCWKAGLAHVSHLYRYHMESGRKLTKQHQLRHHWCGKATAKSGIRVMSTFPCKHPTSTLTMPTSKVSFRTQQPIQLCGIRHSAICAEILAQHISFHWNHHNEPRPWVWEDVMFLKRFCVSVCF